MTNDTSPSKSNEKAAYIKLFDALAGHNLLLDANPPLFTILAATPERLRAVGMTKEAVIGKGLFEAHPGNSTDPTDNGVSNLRASLDHVLRYKEIHQLPVQRYDLPHEQGTFSEKYWRASNRPVLNDEGEVAYIIHTAEDITSQVKAGQREIQLQGVEKIFSLFMHAPMVVGLANGDDYVLEMANEAAFKLWGKGPEEILGKPILQGLPELVGQGIIELFEQVRTSGKPYTAVEVPVTSLLNGRKELHYFNLVYQPYYDKNNAKVTGVFTISHDVTEQVLARKKIEESEVKYRNLFKSIDQGFCVLEMIVDQSSNPIDYLFIEVNPMFEQQTGLKDAVGKRMREMVPHHDEHWFQIYGNVAKTGTSIRFSEGSVSLGRWFDLYAFKVGDVNSQRVAVLFSDITQRKLWEVSLIEKDQNLRNIIHAAPVAMLILRSKEMIIDTINQRMLEMIGQTEAIINQPLLKVLPELKGQPGYESFSTVFSTGKPVYGNEILVPLMREGVLEERYFNFAYTPVIENGTTVGVMDVATDVTEQVLARKKLEEKEIELESALEQVRLSKEAAELGTFDMDLEKGTMHWDDRCRTLFGISHKNPVSYEKDFAHGLHPDDRERILKVIDQLFVKSISNGNYDVEYRTVGAEDGVIRWVRAKGKVYFDVQENPVRFIGSVLDITEKVTAIQKIEKLVEERTKELAQANETLQKINKDLQRSNQNLEEFAYAASHDLKEPVRKILFFTGQLKKQLNEYLKEADIRSFNRIENATRRMGNLIDDLLLYSHVSHRPHETEIIELNQKVRRVLEDLELDIEEKNATIDIGVLPFVKGYRKQLQQLFQNLISNALKYSKAEQLPRIEIMSEEVKKEGKDYYLISVKDNGIGFDPIYSDKIFQMFARLHGKAEYSGTGIGLSIVKKVVENHNGFIEVESVVNEGSVFKIYLPT